MFRSAYMHMHNIILYLHSKPYANYLDWKTLTDTFLPRSSTIVVTGYTISFLHAGMLAYRLLCLNIKATLAIPTPYFTITTICLYIYLPVNFCDGMS